MTTYCGFLLWFVALCQTFGCLFDADLTNHQIRNKNCIVTLFSDFEKRCVIGEKAACTYSSRRKALNFCLVSALIECSELTFVQCMLDDDIADHWNFARTQKAFEHMKAIVFSDRR